MAIKFDSAMSPQAVRQIEKIVKYFDRGFYDPKYDTSRELLVLSLQVLWLQGGMDSLRASSKLKSM